MDGTKDAGLNRVQWNLGPTPVLGGRFGGGGGGADEAAGGGRGVPFTVAQTAVEPGTYVVKLAVGGKELLTSVQVEADDIR